MVNYGLAGTGHASQVPARSPLPFDLNRTIVFSLAFYLCAELGRFLSIQTTSYVSFWIPTGLCCATLLLHESRAWPWLLLATLPANILFDGLHGTPPLTILLFYIANTCEAFVGAWLVRRFVAEVPSLTDLKEFIGLLGFGALVGPAFGAAIGAFALAQWGVSHSFFQAWITWWSSAAMAVLLVAPLILTWSYKAPADDLRNDSYGRLPEALLLLGGLILSVWYVLVLDKGIAAPSNAFLMVFVIWAGLRFGPRGATGSTMLLALLVAFLTTHYQKGLSADQISSGDYIWTMQTLLTLTCVVGLIPSIVLGERNQKLLALHESEERYRNLTAASFEGVFITENGVVLDINDQGLALLGRERHEVIGHPGVEFVCPEFRELVADAFRSNREAPYELRLFRGNSVFDGEVQARMIRVNGRMLRMSALRDITERKLAEQKHLALEEELREAQKMEALGTLAGGTAHEFNNIMGIISGFGELAKMELSEGSSAHPHLDGVLRAVRRARDVVQQILTFSRRQERERRHVHLNSIVAEVLRHFGSTLPSGVELMTDLQGDAAMVIGDATQIHQVVLNVLINAAHATEKRGGTIHVTQRIVELQDSAYRINPALRAGRFARISVNDNGHGMDSAVLTRIFEPFFTTKPHGKGSGLGLAVVHGIMKSHDGAVVVHSEPGKGSGFDLYFPIAVVEAKAVETLPSKDSDVPPQGNGEHILVVDDEPALTDITVRCLRLLGYRATGVHSGSEALEMLSQPDDGIHMVITDLTMPGMSGTTLAKKIREFNSRIPIILATGFVNIDNSLLIHDAGVMTVLQKPITFNALGHAVREVLDS